MSDPSAVLNLAFKSAGIVATDQQPTALAQQQPQLPYTLNHKGELLFVKNRKWTTYEYEENYQLYLKKLGEQLHPQIAEKFQEYESKHVISEDMQPKSLGQNGSFDQVYAMTELERWQSTSVPNGPAGQRAKLDKLPKSFFLLGDSDDEEMSVSEQPEEPADVDIEQQESALQLPWDAGILEDWQLDSPFPHTTECEAHPSQQAARPKTAIVTKGRSSTFVSTSRKSSSAVFEEARFRRRLEIVDSFIKSGVKEFVGTKTRRKRAASSGSALQGEQFTRPASAAVNPPAQHCAQRAARSRRPRAQSTNVCSNDRQHPQQTTIAELVPSRSTDNGDDMQHAAPDPLCTNQPGFPPVIRRCFFQRSKTQPLDLQGPLVLAVQQCPGGEQQQNQLSSRPASTRGAAPNSHTHRTSASESHPHRSSGSTGWLVAAARLISALSARTISGLQTRRSAGVSQLTSSSTISRPASGESAADTQREFGNLPALESATANATTRRAFMTDQLDTTIDRLLIRRERQMKRKTMFGRRRAQNKGARKQKKTVDQFIEACMLGYYQQVLDWLEDEDSPFGPDDVGSSGHTAVYACVLHAMQQENVKNGDAIDQQLPGKVSVSWSAGMKASIWISDHNHHDIVLRILLQRGGDVHFQKTRGDGRGLIHQAVVHNRPDYVEWLIEKGANVDLPTSKDDTTPLMIAVVHERLKIMVQLIRARCDMDAQDLRGNTALHHAAKRNNVNAAYLLLVAGASNTVCNANSRTALDEAVCKRFVKLADMMTLFLSTDFSTPELLTYAEKQLSAPS